MAHRMIAHALYFALAAAGWLAVSGWVVAQENADRPSEDPRPVGLPVATAAAMGLDPSAFARVDAAVDEAIRDGKLPGAVVTVGYRGSIVHQRAYGHRQLLPDELPMTVDTVFDLASLTKPIATATSVMMLVEAGQVELDNTVAQYLPEFGNHGKEAITIEQLMLHVGGVTADNALSDYAGTVEESIANLMKLGLNDPPGKKFRYSDVGFEVLAELIRRVTGKDIHAFSRESIFEPLGMDETGFLPAPPLCERAAPTERRDGEWMRGDVHDPRAFALGGVAGHAGLFSTASDLAIYAQMMVGRGSYQGVTILERDTFERMTRGYQVPGGIRGLGWDKRSGYSSNRGESMTEAAFGHGGFTGTALWIDPELELFVIFLSNRVHPDGKGSVNALAGTVGTIAADAVLRSRQQSESPRPTYTPTVRCGIDVLVRDNFSELDGASVGLITNQTGVDLAGTPTSLLLHRAENVRLVALFSPEHGIAGALDQSEIGDLVDPATGVPVRSLYGKTRRPTPEMLVGIDTLVFDIQDIGTRFYTYIATMGEAMQAAEEQGLRFVVLDRPNPINGVDLAGPVLDDGTQSFVGYHTLPVRHAMTVGELASLFRAERFPDLKLQVIACEGWHREDYFDATGRYWVDPSPNMRNLNQAILYPGVGLLEYTNLSVGRGTDTPFEHVGAPWIDAGRLAADLNAMQLPGVSFVPKRFTPDSSKYENRVCEGIHIHVVDRSVIRPVQVGLAIAVALRKNHPEEWELQPLARLLSSESVLKAVEEGESLAGVMERSERGLEEFVRRREPHMFYSRRK